MSFQEQSMTENQFFESLLSDTSLQPLSKLKVVKMGWALFPDALKYPEFFNKNLVSPGRVIKVLQGKNALLRAFYYQLMKVTFQFEHETDYNEILHSVFYNQKEIKQRNLIPSAEYNYSDLQYRRILAEFSILMQKQSIPNFELTAMQHPIIDQALIYLMESLFPPGYRDSPSAEILQYLCGIFKLTLIQYSSCYKFDEADVFLYEDNPQRLYVAFLSDMAEMSISDVSQSTYKMPNKRHFLQNSHQYSQSNGSGVDSEDLRNSAGAILAAKRQEMSSSSSKYRNTYSNTILNRQKSQKMGSSSNSYQPKDGRTGFEGCAPYQDENQLSNPFDHSDAKSFEVIQEPISLGVQKPTTVTQQEDTMRQGLIEPSNIIFEERNEEIDKEHISFHSSIKGSYCQATNAYYQGKNTFHGNQLIKPAIIQQKQNNRINHQEKKQLNIDNNNNKGVTSNYFLQGQKQQQKDQKYGIYGANGLEGISAQQIQRGNFNQQIDSENQSQTALNQARKAYYQSIDEVITQNPIIQSHQSKEKPDIFKEFKSMQEAKIVNTQVLHEKDWQEPESQTNYKRETHKHQPQKDKSDALISKTKQPKSDKDQILIYRPKLTETARRDIPQRGDDSKGTFYREFTDTLVLDCMPSFHKKRIRAIKEKFRGVHSPNFKKRK